jgi:hypothetical protein
VKYTLDAKHSFLLGQRLLVEQFGETLGGRLAREWHRGRVLVQASIIAYDKFGPTDDEDGACLRGHDAETLYESVSLTVYPKHARVRVTPEEARHLSGFDKPHSEFAKRLAAKWAAIALEEPCYGE